MATIYSARHLLICTQLAALWKIVAHGRFLHRLKGEVELESRLPAVSQDFVHDRYGRVQKGASTERSELLIQIRVKAEKLTTSNKLFATREDQWQVKLQEWERLL
jgi:hypothetical protein